MRTPGAFPPFSIFPFSNFCFPSFTFCPLLSAFCFSFIFQLQYAGFIDSLRGNLTLAKRSLDVFSNGFPGGSDCLRADPRSVPDQSRQAQSRNRTAQRRIRASHRKVRGMPRANAILRRPRIRNEPARPEGGELSRLPPARRRPGKEGPSRLPHFHKTHGRELPELP